MDKRSGSLRMRKRYNAGIHSSFRAKSGTLSPEIFFFIDGQQISQVFTA
jgi:hypothetical protein